MVLKLSYAYARVLSKKIIGLRGAFTQFVQ